MKASEQANTQESTLLKEIPHEGFKAFAKEEMAKKGIFKHIYIIMLAVKAFMFSAGVGYGIALLVLEDQYSYPVQLAAGLLFCFTLLIILHELLHGMAYKMVGARKVYFGAILSQFIFYAGSDQEEFNGKQFRFIAIFPFLCISFICLVCLLLFPEYFLFITTVLFLHTLFCGGDFAVLNFLQQYDLKQIYTYDSREKAKTYFYKNQI